MGALSSILRGLSIGAVTADRVPFQECSETRVDLSLGGCGSAVAGENFPLGTFLALGVWARSWGFLWDPRQLRLFLGRLAPAQDRNSVLSAVS